MPGINISVPGLVCSLSFFSQYLQMAPAPKPVNLDISMTSHVSSHGWYINNAPLKNIDMQSLTTRSKYEIMVKDVEEFGDDYTKTIFANKKAVIEEMIAQVEAKKPRLEAMRDQMATEVIHVINPKKRQLEEVISLMDEVRAKKRASSAAATVEKKRVLRQKVSDIVGPIKEIDEGIADDLFTNILSLVNEIAKDAAANAYVPEE